VKKEKSWVWAKEEEEEEEEDKVRGLVGQSPYEAVPER
jgi:hypothetical protein